jgi:alpha-L-fucosidase 2
MRALRHWIFCLGAVAVLGRSACAASFTPAPLTLWYSQPGHSPLNEGLPIGNGRIGTLILGDAAKERIVLDEDSLWTGGDNPDGGYSPDPDKFGAYQFLGELSVALAGAPVPVDYHRDLDLATATAHVAYKANGSTYEREAFASHPAEVMVFRFTANRSHGYNATIAYADSRLAPAIVEGNRITCAAVLPNGLRHETQILVQTEGGSVEAAGGKLVLHDCDAFTLIVGAGTDYAMDFARGYRGEDPHARVTRQVDAAAAVSYDDLKKAVVADYQSLFNRVTYDFGPSTQAQKMLPFDQRKVEAAKVVDPELEALLVQYGRYLLISCSRPGSLPANLQGLWNNTNKPAWRSDYHTDINVQMNYWPAEVANLAECGMPLFDLIDSQLPSWRKLSAAEPSLAPTDKTPLRGFAIRYSFNIFGGMGWNWNLPGNAWLAQHYWEHFAFGGDRKWLADTGYPFLLEVCSYWEHHLKTLPDGRLVVPKAWSPEHGPTEDGVSYAQEMMWDLFDNTATAARALGDRENADKYTALRGKLAVPGVGSWGQLLEWSEEKKGKYQNMPELDTPEDHHRHTSHLFGVYPGHQISPAKTPALAKAAAVSLAARGDDGDTREWSLAWRTGLWARLLDGEKAHSQLQQMFSERNTCLNLFGLCPPMQIDGNFGFAGTVPEMLLQSQDGDISLLPALPSAWPAGSVTGLRARGGFEVDLQWNDGKLSGGTLRSTWGTSCRVRNGEKAADLHLAPGQSMPLPSSLF